MAANGASRLLTFGLEIEMIVPTGRKGLDAKWYTALGLPDHGEFEDPHPEDGRPIIRERAQPAALEACQTAVHGCLLHAGIENAIINRGFELLESQISEQAEVSQMLFPKVDMKYHHWCVMSDRSCVAEEWMADDELLGRYQWHAVEIASSVFATSAAVGTWISVTPAQEHQMARLCRSLTSRMRIRTSETCGLHVHLGLGGDSIPADTIRRFTTTMWLLESAILCLCAPWRSDSFFAKPIRTDSNLATSARYLQAKVQMDSINEIRMFLGPRFWENMSRLEAQQVALIWTLPLDRLIHAICTADSRGTVSLMGCIPEPGLYAPVANTIEIRYASSTLVAKELTSWTNIFVRIFQLCHYYDDESAVRLKSLLHGVVDSLKPRNTVHPGHELLRLLDLSADISVWRAAEQRWAMENELDKVSKSPFVPPQ